MSNDRNNSYLILPALLVLLGVFPPETRGESMAGCAVLIALLGALNWNGSLDLPRAVPLLLLVVAGVPWILTAQAPGTAARPIAIAALALAAGLGAACLRREIRGLALVLAALGAVVGLHGLYQHFWGLSALVEAIRAGAAIADRAAVLERAAAGRAFAAFATPAAMAGYLALTLPVTAVEAWQRRGALRGVLIASLVAQAAGMLVSASATGAGALMLALVLAGLTRSRARLGAAIVAVALLLAGVVAIRGGEVAGLSAPDSAWKLRAGNFRLAGEIIVDHPWIGVGPGGYGEVYPQYRRMGDNETRHVHNLPLELCAEIGLPLGVAVSVLFFVLFVGPVFVRGAPGRPLPGIEIGLAAFAIQNLADFTAYLPSLLWTAALLRGSLARSRRTILPASAGALVPVLFGTVIAALVAGASGLAWNERMVARDSLAAGHDESARRHARRAATLAPWDPDAWLLHAQTELDSAGAADDPVAHLERVLESVDRAVDLSPVRPAARLLRSRLRDALGDLPGAYSDAAEAARLYPRHGPYAEFRDTLRERLAAEAVALSVPDR